MNNNNNSFGLPLSTNNTVNLELIKAALDSSISGIVITDNQLPDNPIIYCNKSFEELTGFSRNEIIGHNCRFLQAEDRGQVERALIKKSVKNAEHVAVDT